MMSRLKGTRPPNRTSEGIAAAVDGRGGGACPGLRRGRAGAGIRTRQRIADTTAALQACGRAAALSRPHPLLARTGARPAGPRAATSRRRSGDSRRDQSSKPPRASWNMRGARALFDRRARAPHSRSPPTATAGRGAGQRSWRAERQRSSRCCASSGVPYRTTRRRGTALNEPASALIRESTPRSRSARKLLPAIDTELAAVGQNCRPKTPARRLLSAHRHAGRPRDRDGADARGAAALRRPPPPGEQPA